MGAGLSTTSGQVAIAWLLAQGSDITPISGTEREKYLEEENLGASSVKLTNEEVAEVHTIAENAEVKGPRYLPGMQEQLFVETPAL
ncbi:hypothetical protein DFH11DRAFT_1876691 [Phellopilus nigrolimitatus]|nr:hypothetical protein DFH11DRAFT_1876691 [Phellopilus nigrolimitatus]